MSQMDAHKTLPQYWGKIDRQQAEVMVRAAFTDNTTNAENNRGCYLLRASSGNAPANEFSLTLFAPHALTCLHYKVVFDTHMGVYTVLNFFGDDGNFNAQGLLALCQQLDSNFNAVTPREELNSKKDAKGYSTANAVVAANGAAPQRMISPGTTPQFASDPIGIPSRQAPPPQPQGGGANDDSYGFMPDPSVAVPAPKESDYGAMPAPPENVPGRYGPALFPMRNSAASADTRASLTGSVGDFDDGDYGGLEVTPADSSNSVTVPGGMPPAGARPTAPPPGIGGEYSGLPGFPSPGLNLPPPLQVSDYGSMPAPSGSGPMSAYTDSEGLTPTGPLPPPGAAPPPVIDGDYGIPSTIQQPLPSSAPTNRSLYGISPGASLSQQKSSSAGSTQGIGSGPPPPAQTLSVSPDALRRSSASRGHSPVRGGEAAGAGDLDNTVRDLATVKIGDRVEISNKTKLGVGVVRFCGKIATTDLKKNEAKKVRPEWLWVGLEFKMPVGKNDGKLGSTQYFHCDKKCGLFVPLADVGAKVLSAGWVQKKASKDPKVHRFQKRFLEAKFYLNSERSFLQYYKGEKDEKPRGIIPLSEGNVTLLPDDLGDSKPHKNASCCFKLQHLNRDFLFEAPTKERKDSWLQSIRSMIAASSTPRTR